MPAGNFAASVAEMPLVDGHCHVLLAGPHDAATFEIAATEASLPAPPDVSYLDGALGLAIRRWCAPVLDLPAGAPIVDYLERRARLGADEVAHRLLRAAGLSQFLVDTGLAGPALMSPVQLGALAGGRVREVVRLETVAEQVASEDPTAEGFASAFADALAEATTGAVAVKSILAYRYGFDADLGRPSSTEVRRAAAGWLSQPGPGRIEDPVLLRFVLWCGVDCGLPIQMHAGFGDRDLRLAQADPALLQPFLAAVEPIGVPIVLLHCYPFHRQAGWLAQVYPHVYLDVGLTIAQVGAQAGLVLGEFFELAPFGKLLFSTDGYALPELFLVGAAQFRNSLIKLVGGWTADGAMPPEEAVRLAGLVGSRNAERVYRL
ncbi:MAG TPA: amidohydrolase family protein [Actinomycetota bacterium]|nr:amidohydrolase family protein [Actinomycetota bacterium]